MKDPAEMKKYQPYLLPMNREESQRYNGIRQALLGKGPGFEDPMGVGQHYGVVFPQMPMAMPEEKKSVGLGPEIPTQMTPDPNLPGPIDPSTIPTGVDPAALGMPNMAPQAGMMPQPNPMQNQMQNRGLGKLMARLGARVGGF